MRLPSHFSEPMVSICFFLTALDTKALTEGACQPVAFIKSSMFAPSGRRRSVITVTSLLVGMLGVGSPFSDGWIAFFFVAERQKSRDAIRFGLRAFDLGMELPGEAATVPHHRKPHTGRSVGQARHSIRAHTATLQCHAKSSGKMP